MVAYHLSPSDLKSDLVGFENHLNVYHNLKEGLDEYLARGLTLFLNSKIMDDHFRVFSGHTQVNATDLRAIRYPSIKQLKELGKRSLEISNDQFYIENNFNELRIL